MRRRLHTGVRLLPLLAVAAQVLPRRAAAESTQALPAEAHAISRSASASRDAPVIEYAYGPRAQLSLGGTVGLLRVPRAVSFHLALGALAAFENAQQDGPLPDELGRLVIELDTSWSLDCWAPRVLGAGAAVELGTGLGFERARELRGSEAKVIVAPPRPEDIPFGAGGGWVTLDAALRLPLGRRFTLTTRLRERVFWNALPDLFGSRDASNAVADTVGEGLSHAPSLDLALRWRLSRRLRPLASLFVEALRPHDDHAAPSWFLRTLVGLGLPAPGGEALPFLALEVGSGKGLLVNRHEVRIAAGVRLAR